MIVIVESPFRGSSREQEAYNRLYLSLCLRDSILRGETPLASHQMYTDCLDDSYDEERQLGISLGYQLWENARGIVFYLDLGWSVGMRLAYHHALDWQVHAVKPRRFVEIRTLNGGPLCSKAVSDV